MADVRIIKFDVGSPTDLALNGLQARLGASTGVEAFRRSLSIADTVTEILKDKNKKLVVRDENGKEQEIVLGGF